MLSSALHWTLLVLKKNML